MYTVGFSYALFLRNKAQVWWFDVTKRSVNTRFAFWSTIDAARAAANYFSSAYQLRTYIVAPNENRTQEIRLLAEKTRAIIWSVQLAKGKTRSENSNRGGNALIPAVLADLARLPNARLAIYSRLKFRSRRIVRSLTKFRVNATRRDSPTRRLHLRCSSPGNYVTRSFLFTLRDVSR